MHSKCDAFMILSFTVFAHSKRSVAHTHTHRRSAVKLSPLCGSAPHIDIGWKSNCQCMLSEQWCENSVYTDANAIVSCPLCVCVYTYLAVCLCMRVFVARKRHIFPLLFRQSSSNIRRVKSRKIVQELIVFFFVWSCSIANNNFPTNGRRKVATHLGGIWINAFGVEWNRLNKIIIKTTLKLCLQIGFRYAELE